MNDETQKKNVNKNLCFRIFASNCVILMRNSYSHICDTFV